MTNFLGCFVQTLENNLDEVCCIYPTSVLLSPHNTIQEVGGLVIREVGEMSLV